MPRKKKTPVGADAPSLNDAFFLSVGGSKRTLQRKAWSTPTALTQGGESEVWDFGWIPEEARNFVPEGADKTVVESQ